eukprot:EG_transcript_972
MQLSVIFVCTLAVSVVISSCATWGLTYSTSYSELQNMAGGFVGLATTSVDEFRQLVTQLLADSTTLTSGILTNDYNRSMTQLSQSEQELLQTTLELMNQTRNATAQSQQLVADLVVSFGSFMRSAISEFETVGTEDSSDLRVESATRAQLVFSDMLQDAALAVRRTAQLHDMAMLNVSWPMDQAPDDGICTLMGSICIAGADAGDSLYVGTATGAKVNCNPTGKASNLLLSRGVTADNYTYVYFPAYNASTAYANFTAWKQPCLANQPISTKASTCPHGTGASYPTYCNGTCGYDSRCRPWYYIHNSSTVPWTRMTDVYTDSGTGKPVFTLSYPIYSSSGQLLAVTATDFYLSTVDTFLGTLSSTQFVAVVFNTSDLMVMGTSRACPNTNRSSGKPIADSCDPTLEVLGGWLSMNRNLAGNVSVELSGTLWNVFPGTVESFSYFVVVGMNKTQVYAVVTATSQAANQTLQTLSQQQTARMAKTEADSLAQMEKLSADKIATLQTMQVQSTQYMEEEYARMDATFNASRQQSAAQLASLTSSEMRAINDLEDYHLSKVKNSIGTTFGSVVGIFIAVLLCAVYGTWIVVKQVQQIAQVMEDVAHMRVEQLEVTQNSRIREVQRIEAALVVLVGRLAEYKTYMPAGLFQAENAAPLREEAADSPCALTALDRKRTLGSVHSTPRHAREHSVAYSQSSDRSSVRPPPVAGCTRLMRRSAAVMAVNVVRFRAEAAQRSTGHVEGNLNRVISAVHSAAAKVQGNIDAIVGDQLLVTFNAHFTCSDPCTAASTAALEVLATLKGDTAFAWRVQIGLAAGAVHTGHLGTTSFKSMVAIGAPMKVSSLLSHLSGFEEPTVLVCPSLEERIKYTFRLQPVDLVALPALGEFNPLYAKSICIFSLMGHDGRHSGSQEWLYEVGGGDSGGKWTAVFRELAKATCPEKAAEDLRQYLTDHPEDRLASRLLHRLPRWQPRVGIVLAERPDDRRAFLAEDAADFKFSMCDLEP